MISIKTNLLCTVLFFLAIAMFSIIAIAQTNSDAKPPESQVEKISGLNARFIVALISDGNDGAWIGTEDEGVFHWQADGKITQFTTKNGLGDNNGYALAIDARGRLWVGHLNTGVSVFNGKDWRNYDVVDGPIGERIFDIEICPKDGDVWMATSAGLTRFRLSHQWEHYTREDGLLEDQVSALAFKKDGTLIVGTQCHGLAIFTRDENGHYTHERNIVAPERFGQDNCSPVPLTSTGKGLPSNLINDIIVAQNSASQTIWIATSAGLVKADNDLKNLEYQRGRDYAAKVHGLYGGAPKNFKAAPEVLMKRLLPEDYLTALVEDGVGQIYVGMRQNGFLISDPVSGRRWFGTQKESGLTDNFVTKIAILEDGNFLVGTYGGGVVKSTKPFNLTIRQPKKSDDLRRPNIVAQNEETRRDLPIEIKPPTIEDLKWMQKKLATLTKPLPKTHASYYGEDWKTQGDGLGRAFYNWAIMCACVSPLDREIRFFSHYYTANSFIGPNATPDDTIRRWVHWKKTDNPKVLWDPLNGYRRQSEWDDHGEAYPMSKDGPDVWYLLEVKHQGAFKLGMYFFNKDGHDGNNRWRDYVIEIYPAKAAWKGNPYDTWKQYSKEAEQVARTTPPLEKCRVRDFWGGVYKQFNLTGGFYYVKIRRNYSFNTIISAVTMDRLKGQLTHGEWCGIPFVSDMLPDESRYKYFPKRLPTDSDKIEDWHTIRFLRTLDRVYDKSGGMAVQRKWRIDTYRFAKARARTTNNEKMAKIAEYLEWTLNQWDDKQKKEWRDTMEAAFKKYYDTSPTLWKTIEEQKNGVPEFIRDRHKWE